ncbi:MAG TPA: DUF4440 domain-containing protein [Gemmatimonadaceae bacterium]|nr:DUF4440 domain-containing protein [Gemmatimonadaceae bacterium]
MPSGKPRSTHQAPSRLTRLGIIGAFTLVTVCATGRAGGAQTPKADTGVRGAVARINREFPSLARAGNASAAAGWFAPDAILYANGMPAIRGRAAIQQFYAGFFQSMPIRDMTFTTEEITERGDIAIETGANSITIGAPSQSAAPSVAGKYLAVWKRQPNGQWLIWRHSPSGNATPPGR